MQGENKMTNRAYENAQNNSGRPHGAAEYRKARKERKAALQATLEKMAEEIKKTFPPEPLCSCFEFAGDNPECPVHYPKAEGSDNRMSTQMREYLDS
jgi:hypothetical protein